MNNCKTCKHFSPDTDSGGFGSCALMGDSNEGMADNARAYGWDHESYAAGVHVGENFGCVHWCAASSHPLSFISGA